MNLLKTRTMWLLMAAGAISAASLSSRADTPPPAAAAPEAQIPFAKRNIWNWQVVDDKTVLIQDIGGKWYKATLFATCIDLPFADKIGFDSGPTGTFDKFGAILVRGQRCPLSSLVETTAPPKKSKAKKPEPAEAPH